MKKWFNPVTIIGLFVVAMGLWQLASKFLEPSDIWWTPRSLAVPLAESRDRVEVLVGGELLQKRIEDGALMLKAEDGSSRAVEAPDVTLRFNTWDARRADLYWQGMFSAACFSCRGSPAPSRPRTPRPERLDARRPRRRPPHHGRRPAGGSGTASVRTAQ